MPATKEKSPAAAAKPRSVAEIIAQAAADRQELRRAVESICFRLVEEYGDETPEAWKIHAHLAPDDRATIEQLWGPMTDKDGKRTEVGPQLIKEINRCRNVKHWQAAAGTSAARQAASDRSAAATQALTDNGDRLQAEIEQLQRQLAGLVRERDAAARMVEGHEAAIARLRDLVPQHVTDEIRRQRQAIDEDFAELRELESRQNALAPIVRPPDSLATAIWVENLTLWLQHYRPELLRDPHQYYGAARFTPEAAAYREELKDELATIDARIAELKPQRDAAYAQADALRDIYCR